LIETALRLEGFWMVVSNGIRTATLFLEKGFMEFRGMKHQKFIGVYNAARFFAE
jgi:hypothetical protein